MFDPNTKFELAPESENSNKRRIPVLVFALVLVILVIAVLVFQILNSKPIQLTDEQKLETLSKLSSNQSLTPLTEKQKLSILGKLAGSKTTTVNLSDAEKLKILQQLRSK